MAHLKTAFGAEIPVTGPTSSRVSEYKGERLDGKSTRTEHPLTAADISRPLALLRHLLRVAHEEWEVLSVVPKVRLELEPHFNDTRPHFASWLHDAGWQPTHLAADS